MQKKKKIIAFDLETIADPMCLEFLPEVKANGTLKKPSEIKTEIDSLEKEIKNEGFAQLQKRSQTAAYNKLKKLYINVNAAAGKIKADIDKKMAKQIADMGLSPIMNLICCAGWYTEENGPEYLNIENATREEEKELLIKFWEVLSGHDLFVSFNGMNFDVRCMLLHGIHHGIRPPVKIDCNKYSIDNHVDLRNILSGTNVFATGRLDDYCKILLGMGKLEGIDGEMVQSFWDMGLIDDIVKYNQQEIGLIYQLYKKVEIAGLLE